MEELEAVQISFGELCKDGCCMEVLISNPNKHNLSVADVVAALSGAADTFGNKFTPDTLMATIIQRTLADRKKQTRPKKTSARKKVAH